jgi:hypothetical protein
VVNRRELEGLVALALREVRAAESSLERRYRGLNPDDVRGLRSFLNSLEQLETRAGDVEKLLTALKQPRRVSPLAA